jgi:hypothetical protein
MPALQGKRRFQIENFKFEIDIKRDPSTAPRVRRYAAETENARGSGRDGMRRGDALSDAFGENRPRNWDYESGGKPPHSKSAPTDNCCLGGDEFGFGGGYGDCG